MFKAASITSASLLAIGITGTSAKIGNYNSVGGGHDTITAMCAEANPPRYSAVAKLCKELGTDGLNFGLDDTVLLSVKAVDRLVGNEGPTFNMRDILEAEDVVAAYNKIMASTLRTERKLLVDYGWCSSAAGFLGGVSADSSNYCDPSQSCDSSMGCEDPLSACCITHDKCLQGPGSGTTSRCDEVDCSGSSCDEHLSACAWNVSCCTWWSCDYQCIAFSSGIAATFNGVGSWSPQHEWNPDGSNSDAMCTA